MIFVAAAGNNSQGLNTDIYPQYPSCYDVDNVVSVAATDSADLLAEFSNYGQTTVDLAAPGVDIYSCYNTSDSAYDYAKGTSMATPHVSGALALLAAQFPNKTYAELIRRLYDNVDPLSSLSGRCTTGGRLNLAKALGLATPTNLTPGSANPDGSVRLTSTSATLSWNAVPAADRYHLIAFYWDWNGGAWVADKGLLVSSTNFSYSVPVNNTHYAWTLAAGNATLSSEWANWAYFYENAPCTYTLTPSSASFTAAAGSGSVNVSGMRGCAWTAQSAVSWITMTSGSSGNGNGAVTYSVAANTTKKARTGSLTIAGKTFYITQGRR